MPPGQQAHDSASAAVFIADICAALRSVEPIEERTGLVASAAAGARILDARLAQIQASLDRIEARLAEVEHELALLIKPSAPF